MRKLFLKVIATAFILNYAVLAFAEYNDFSHRYKAMRVPGGQIIAIPLKADHSAGFSWYLTKISDKTVVEFVKKEYAAYSGKTAGTGGEEKWIFKTLKKGKATLSFEYKQPWEKEAPGQRKEELNILVD